MSQISERSSSDLNIDAKVAEIRREYRFYQKNGEKHPLYNITWKIFWERRYAELKKEGKHNPDQYDYKVDWVKYWMNYIKEYYYNKMDFYKKKDMKRLHLSPISISSSEDSGSSKSSKRRHRRYSNSSSEDSYYSKDHKKSLRNAESFSSIDTDAFLDNHATSRYEAVTLLSVCRTLAVLDAELGSLLSNKIVDLIAKCIELEKVQANSSDEFLMSSDNSTFLETVKEKLKGLVYTNLLEPKKIPVAKKCIQNIAQLVHQNRPKPTEKKQQHQIVMDPELTEIIAKALISFGKNDVLPEELDVIREIYLEELEKNIEMAQKDNEKCHLTTNLSKFNISYYKKLDDDELNTLIKNFSQLDEDEQNEFISFITEIEETDPERVRRLQDFINGQKPSATIVINDYDDDDYNFDELVATIK